jgi:hypothetical protein
MALPREGSGTECEAVRCGRVGCEGEGWLLAIEVKRQKTSTSSVSVRVRKEVHADGKQGRRRMIRLIAVAGFLAFATSAQAMSPAPIPQPDGMITQVRLACGPGRTRVGGVCVARTTIRHVRRGYRRGYY